MQGTATYRYINYGSSKVCKIKTMSTDKKSLISSMVYILEYFIGLTVCLQSYLMSRVTMWPNMTEIYTYRYNTRDFQLKGASQPVGH